MRSLAILSAIGAFAALPAVADSTPPPKGAARGNAAYKSKGRPPPAKGTERVYHYASAPPPYKVYDLDKVEPIDEKRLYFPAVGLENEEVVRVINLADIDDSVEEGKIIRVLDLSQVEDFDPYLSMSIIPLKEAIDGRGIPLVGPIEPRRAAAVTRELALEGEPEPQERRVVYTKRVFKPVVEYGVYTIK